MVFIYFCLCLLPVYVKCHYYDVTNTTDFSKCDVYYARSGIIYKDFFELPAEPPANKHLTLDFHFSVLTPSDAHILLATSQLLGKGDFVYEIVVGAGGNTFSDIRLAQKAEVRASVSTKNILSSKEIRSFWIHIYKGGLIEVGKEGEEVAFLSWQDQKPLPLKVFSFSTWDGIEAKFFYNCPNEVFMNDTVVKKNLTHIERLRNDLLFSYDPYVRPVAKETDFTLVKMSLVFNYVSFDVYKSQLELKANVALFWKDVKLRWNPKDYGNISNLHLNRQEVWKPKLTVYNSFRVSAEYDMLGDAIAVVNYTGDVEWKPTANINTWCAPRGLGYWPNDFYKCELVFGFVYSRDIFWMNLEVLGNTQTFLEKMYTSEWEVEKVKVYSAFGWHRPLAYSLVNRPSKALELKLKRTSDVYTKIFFTPFLVISVMALASFWMSPFGQMKFFCGCFQLILTSLFTISLLKYVPSHPEKVPYFVFLYSSTTVANFLCLVVSTLVIWLSRTDHEYSLPHIIVSIINSRFMRIVFFMPPTKVPEKYGDLNETTSTMIVERTQTMWTNLGIFIDRVAFIGYAIFAITLYCMQY